MQSIWVLLDYRAWFLIGDDDDDDADDDDDDDDNDNDEK